MSVAKWITGIVMVLFFAGTGVVAATIEWDGGGGDTNWTTAANWVGDVEPGPADRANFSATDVATLNATRTIDNLTPDGNALVTIGSSGALTARGMNIGFTGSTTYPTLVLQNGSSLIITEKLFSGSGGAGEATVDLQSGCSFVHNGAAGSATSAFIVGSVRNVMFQITGAGSTIQFSDVIPSARLESHANMKFIFTGNDISSVDFLGSLELNADQLIIDASGITATGTYTLINYGSLSGHKEFNTITIENLAAGFGARVVDTGSSFDLIVGTPATVTWDGDVGDWTTATNWDGDVLPGLFDTVKVLAGTPTLNATTTVAKLQIDRLNDTDWGTVTLGSNADLTVTTSFNMGYNNNSSAPKLLLKSGSHLIFNNNLFAGTLGTGSAEFRVQGTASLIQSDGAANLQLGIVRTVNLIAEGSGGTIRFASNISNICRISKNVNFRFIFEENAITPIDFGSTVELNSPDLYVDASGITATGTYTLINYADGLTGQRHLDEIHITNLGAGLAAKVVDSGSSFDLVVSRSSYSTWAFDYGLTQGASGDDDGDGLSNLAEYGLGGNPTNGFLDAEMPVFRQVGGSMEYIHAQRTDDDALGYYLELTDSLVVPNWTNDNYTVVGTNVTGGLFDYVTNSIPTVDSKKFIRLVIEN